MKYTAILVVTLGLVLCVLSAGCTSPTQVKIKPQETTGPTPSPTTSTSTSYSSSTATVVSTPVAAQTLPPGQAVDIYVEKQRPDATVHLLYNGGEGEGYIQNIMMRVTRSDGIVEEKYLNDGTRKPSRGDELIIDGTRGIDQVAVFITSAGITYKVFDKPLMVSRY
jgi:hypothetical protein